MNKYELHDAEYDTSSRKLLHAVGTAGYFLLIEILGSRVFRKLEKLFFE